MDEEEVIGQPVTAHDRDKDEPLSPEDQQALVDAPVPPEDSPDYDDDATVDISVDTEPDDDDPDNRDAPPDEEDDDE